jgi:hypothetical protein
VKIVEVARFASFSEALVAAGALRSAGLHAETWDTHLNANYFILQQAFGGVRVVVPSAEQAEARELLQALWTAPDRPQSVPAASLRKTVAAVALFFLFGDAGAWAVAKFRPKLPD